MPHAPRHKLGYDDYARLPDDGKRYELLDGEVLVTPAPSPRHQQAVVKLLEVLRAHFRRGARVFVAPLDVVLSPHDVLQPDLVVVDDPSAISERAIERPPLLVVEVLSPSTEKRDRGLKLDRYAALGVRHAWLVDHEIPAIACFRLAPGSIARVVQASDVDAIVEHPDFPDLAFRLGTIQEP
ncbi:MAG TPA: Uma2 family endonuclease [Candidatus Polarisedimenticolaceae bacterium]